MTSWISALQYASAGVIVLLAIGVVRRWLRSRDTPLGTLALAVGTLAGATVSGRINALTSFRLSILSIIGVVLFIASGYGLFLFRQAQARPHGAVFKVRLRSAA